MRQAAAFAIAQQVIWWAAMLGGSVAAVISAIAGAAIWWRSSQRPTAAEWRFALIVAGCGFVLDLLIGAFIGVRWQEINAQLQRVDVIAPVWLFIVWLAFAASLPRVFAVVWQRPAMASLLLAPLAPFSYWAGMRLGAAEIAAPLPWLFSLALCWAAMPWLWQWWARQLQLSAQR